MSQTIHDFSLSIEELGPTTVTGLAQAVPPFVDRLTMTPAPVTPVELALSGTWAMIQTPCFGS